MACAQPDKKANAGPLACPRCESGFAAGLWRGKSRMWSLPARTGWHRCPQPASHDKPGGVSPEGLLAPQRFPVRHIPTAEKAANQASASLNPTLPSRSAQACPPWHTLHCHPAASGWRASDRSFHASEPQCPFANKMGVKMPTSQGSGKNGGGPSSAAKAAGHMVSAQEVPGASSLLGASFPESQFLSPPASFILPSCRAPAWIRHRVPVAWESSLSQILEPKHKASLSLTSPQST